MTPARVAIGGRVAVTFVLRSTARTAQDLLVDLAVHFVKAGGHSTPKVFKLKRVSLPPRGTRRLPRQRVARRAHHAEALSRPACGGRRRERARHAARCVRRDRADRCRSEATLPAVARDLFLGIAPCRDSRDGRRVIATCGSALPTMGRDGHATATDALGPAEHGIRREPVMVEPLPSSERDFELTARRLRTAGAAIALGAALVLLGWAAGHRRRQEPGAGLARHGALDGALLRVPRHGAGRLFGRSAAGWPRPPASPSRWQLPRWPEPPFRNTPPARGRGSRPGAASGSSTTRPTPVGCRR